MNIDQLTIKQAKELANLFVAKNQPSKAEGLNDMLGKYVIIRTYSAGVWFGILDQKSGKEVILKEARRMYQFWCAKGISLSSVALYGLKQDTSRICASVDEVWLEAIEILPTNSIATESLKSAPEAEQS
jgi:hypothetical protein